MLLTSLNRKIVSCRRCPRLVEWREQVASEKVKRFADEVYWGRPVPGFGDSRARLLLVGLAPAAHGANRTGRMFTGDRSGDWLYRALHKAGFSNQPTSIGQDDGLRLKDCFITASARCAPPQNKLASEEKMNCRPFLLKEIGLLQRVQVVIGLGKIGFDSAYDGLVEVRELPVQRRPRFSHGREISLAPNLTLLASFHPSQQNTFTGKLTEPMIDAIFDRARTLIH